MVDGRVEVETAAADGGAGGGAGREAAGDGSAGRCSSR